MADEISITERAISPMLLKSGLSRRLLVDESEAEWKLLYEITMNEQTRILAIDSTSAQATATDSMSFFGRKGQPGKQRISLCPKPRMVLSRPEESSKLQRRGKVIVGSINAASHSTGLKKSHISQRLKPHNEVDMRKYSD
ncbi:predicted protein [Histoplasma capsulatum H143]|uniref:Uncharacterized protein n=1 Tax=Ajellomyces capsulatus (strain H143) TaxID=544712 RepID=C6HKX8_AJECH|nr:predicted protein [Histoplasma capsulatum H143]